MATTVSLSSSNFTAAGNTINIGPLTINVPSPAPQINGVNFASGTFVATSGPAGATLCLITPPSSNAVQLTLKGVTGDTGIPISASNPTLVSFFNTSISNTVGLTSAAAITGPVTLTWI